MDSHTMISDMASKSKRGSKENSTLPLPTKRTPIWPNEVSQQPALPSWPSKVTVHNRDSEGLQSPPQSGSCVAQVHNIAEDGLELLILLRAGTGSLLHQTQPIRCWGWNPGTPKFWESRLSYIPRSLHFQKFQTQLS